MTLQEIQHKAQSIIHKWRDDDSAPYIEFVDELAHMIVPEPSADLEEVADNHIRKVVDTAGHPGWDWTTQDIAEAFIAGAKWALNQGVKATGTISPRGIIYDNNVGYHLFLERYHYGDKVEVQIRKIE